jgi:cell division protein FtsZ
MSLHLVEEQSGENKAVIKVIGVGGGGGNAIGRMMDCNLRGVDFVAVNTDAQALTYCQAPQKVQIGAALTGGLGSGADPEIGRRAAEEDRDSVVEALRGADMVFITAGMGGGTGTGAAPVVAEVAKELGALTAAIVTKPFSFEGQTRRERADDGLALLREVADTLIVISNDALLDVVDTSTTMLEAFRMADNVLYQGVQCVCELVSNPGIINLDFADVRTIMKQTGTAVMGVGVGRGENRAEEAAGSAITCPLLEHSNIRDAKGVIINIAGGKDLTMLEVNRAAAVIHRTVRSDANIIFGAAVRDEPREEVSVTVIATGFTAAERPAEVKRPTEMVLFNELEIEEPAFIRYKKRPRRKSPTTRKQPGFSRTDLDIPAFMRRKEEDA